MNNSGSYEEYAAEALAQFRRADAATREALVRALDGRPVSRVLDLGCGPGQNLLPFLELTEATCVGVDVAEGLGPMTRSTFAGHDRAAFVRTMGEELPFADGSFDVVLCRVALPYMDNRAAIAEIARVMSPDGVLLLKVHAPRYFFGMIAERISTFSPRMLAYPLICIAGSVWHLVTGRQLTKGFWTGKEVFQTTAFLRREFARNGLTIAGRLPDDNPKTPSFSVIKSHATRVAGFLTAFASALDF